MVRESHTPKNSDSQSETRSHLIGQGSHGCAFVPPLPCKQTKVKKSKKGLIVGKIIDKRHADIELDVANLVKGIIGWDRYFIVQEEDNCNSENFKRERGTYETACNIMKSMKNKNLTQIISPYGGSTLQSMSITSSFDFLGSFKHLLDGIAKLQNQGICHYDLKSNNIVIDYTGTFRIIDFGSAFLGDGINKNNIWRHQYSFLPEYTPQPPELSVQNGIHSNFGYSRSIQETIQQKKIFKTMENIFGIPIEKYQEELTAFWNEDTTWKGDTWVDFFHAYWRVWDAWAIGAIYIKLLEKCFLHQTFVNEVWPFHGAIIRQVLKGLLMPDPRKRLSCVEAAKLLEFY